MPQEMFSIEHCVTLREITADTLREILKLEVTESQKQFVAPNAVSIAQAYFTKTAWFRGIYCEDVPVGFVMLDADETKPEYFLWRFMIDQNHQGKGYGKEAIEMLTEYVKTLPNAVELTTSCVSGDGGPEAFYTKMGFEATGDTVDNEKVLRLVLASNTDNPEQ